MLLILNIIMHYSHPKTYFKSSNKPPLLDPRTNPHNDYEVFKSEAYNLLCCYRTIVDDILTHEPISLILLQKTLRVTYRFPMSVITRTINFISNTKLRGIEWIERENIREPLIKLHDPTLSRTPPTGSYSPYFPKGK